MLETMKTNDLFFLLAVIALLAGFGYLLVSGYNKKPVTPPPAPKVAGAQAEQQPMDLKIEDIATGSGKIAQKGDKLTVNYTGTLADTGQVFDSSVGKQPFSFKLGAGDVIPGWDQGLVGMKVGGKRKLTIPPSLAYGDKGAGNTIPPKATLVFEVELLDASK
jgi:FKBP-type peptidyl-prolyl cis-trans isomerase